ncbi:MAG: circadian clock protein KaiC [Frankiales bacterium]|jgi:circadian clock protein KaiC|nr:circadian clock protein KaiC [Frankiales bacterium]
MSRSEELVGPAIRTARAADALVLGAQDTLGTRAAASVPKLVTGIPGFDAVTMGGLPRRRVTVIAGQAGSAKTVFASHFLAEGIRRGQPGVFVTLEEPAADLRANLTTLGWDIQGWEAAGDVAIVDASPLVRDEELPSYNFETLAAQIGHAVDATGADRLVLDSLNTALAFEENPAIARQRLRGLIASLRGMGLTVVMTVETPGDPGSTLSRHGIEEFVADCVVLLRHVHEGIVRRRSVEVLKMRGAMHRKGDHAFTVLPGQGVVVLPQPVISQGQAIAPVRTTTGNAGLDAMTHGGIFQDSTVLVTGPTGSGKTLVCTEFLAGAAEQGERVLMLSYDEGPDQLFRHAAGWGKDFAGYQEAGLLEFVALYPEVASLDDHLVEIMDRIDQFRPTRIALDSLTSLQRVGSPASYRQFVVGLSAYLKQEQIACLLTLTSTNMPGQISPYDLDVLSTTDGLIRLQYAETGSEVQRAVTVLKLRGTSHDHQIRRYTISDQGLEIGEPSRGSRAGALRDA